MEEVSGNLTRPEPNRPDRPIFYELYSSVMMMIAPNSRARKGEKEREEVKREYGGI